MPNRTLKNAQVHRFFNQAAICLPRGETVYLSAAEARQIGEALVECSVDIVAASPNPNQFKTVSVPLENEGRRA
jgi:hypothetical protein